MLHSFVNYGKLSSFIGITTNDAQSEEERKMKKAWMDLEEVAKDLHENLEDCLFQIAYSICQLHLNTLEACKVVGSYLYSKILWKELRDLVIANSFKLSMNIHHP